MRPNLPSPRLDVRLVAPDQLAIGTVNVLLTPAGREYRIDRREATPEFPGLFAAAALDARRDIRDIVVPGRPPIVRIYLESISGIACDVSPEQVDLYVSDGLLTQRAADELSAHSSYALRRFPP